MKRLICFPIFLLVLYTSTAFSQKDTIPKTYAVEDTLSGNFGLFEHTELLPLDLRFDIKQYSRKKPKIEYLDGILTYHITPKDSVNRTIRIKSRGEFRNGYCNFPPIQVNLKNAGFKKEDVKKIGKMKLVTHCMSGNEDYVFKEYLAYKLFNVLTDVSFRVRLLKINYIDTGRKNKVTTTFGFFIEPAEMLAERTKMTEIASTTLSQKDMFPEVLDRMAIFQYMIGNADWSIANQHNCKVFLSPGLETRSMGISIPYDFDYTGLVNADYAVPNESSKITSVRERIYTGLCRSKETFEKELAEFADHKTEFYKVINDFPYISARQKKEMNRYLDEFFSEFDSQNSIVNDFLRTCKE